MVVYKLFKWLKKLFDDTCRIRYLEFTQLREKKFEFMQAYIDFKNAKLNKDQTGMDEARARHTKASDEWLKMSKDYELKWLTKDYELKQVARDYA